MLFKFPSRLESIYFSNLLELLSMHIFVCKQNYTCIGFNKSLYFTHISKSNLSNSSKILKHYACKIFKLLSLPLGYILRIYTHPNESYKHFVTGTLIYFWNTLGMALFFKYYYGKSKQFSAK